MGKCFTDHGESRRRLCLFCSFLLRNDQQSRNVIAKASYYEDVPAVVGKENVFGMQFHPEKSSQAWVGLHFEAC